MNWRLMRYWSSLRGDEPYARIAEFNVEAVPGFGPHAFMLDLNDTPEDPLVRFVGQSLSLECGRNMTGKRLSAVPLDSLLARVANHYRDVQVAKAPFEFADEYVNETNELVLYRGIMLPFTRGGRSIDYIVGAITNKKEAADGSDIPAAPADGDALSGEAGDLDAQALLSLVKTDVAADREPAEPEVPPVDLPALTNSLDECRSLARKIDAADARSRKALYATLDRVYSFASEAESDPGALQALLSAEGLSRQDRAPFTPIVKLVFGADYNKTRLSEYEAALGYARRQGQPAPGFRSFVEQQAGGLKGCVAAERAARRAERGDRTDKVAEAKERLRALDPIGTVEEAAPGTEEFVLILGRRGGAASGAIDILALLDEKQSVLDGILKRAAKRTRRRRSKPKAGPITDMDLEPRSGPAEEPDLGIAEEPAEDADLEITDSVAEVAEEEHLEAPSLEERAVSIPGLDESISTEAGAFSTDLDEIEVEVEVADIDPAT